MKKIGKIRICSEEWDLLADPTDGGGECHWYPKNSPSSYVTIGTECPDPNRWLSVLVHEILESILMVDEKRFLDEDHANHRFLFDHEYLRAMPRAFIDALLSSGFFTINKAKIKQLKAIRSTRKKAKK